MPELPLEITCAGVVELRHAADEFVLLDCREEDEFAIAKIEGARLVPMSQIATRVAELEPLRERRVVVHCHHGGRSLRVAQWLRQQGFGQAQSMSGGIDAWSLEIDPTVTRY